EEMRRLEATGTYTDDEINRLARGGKQRGHIPGVGRVLPARATASPCFRIGFRSFHGDMLPGNMCHSGTYFLTEKYVRPTVSPRIVDGEGIPYERSPATFPWRQIAGETYPQRQVAGKRRYLSLEKRLNVAVFVLFSKCP
nr:F-box domain, leucine-rich repeat domain, L domain-like protein [Tanacetum cinerariifolium]